MTERYGIEIDYCPQCRGVWLDRGELDKIIERSAAAPMPQPQQRYDADRGHQTYRPAEPYRSSDDDDRRYREGHGKKRRESFLGDIFDF